MMLNKQHVTDTKSLPRYHILRARIIQMLEAEGYKLKGLDWKFYVEPIAKGKPKKMMLAFTGEGSSLEFALSMTGTYLSGTTQFFLYRGLSNVSHIGLKVNTPALINCRECSGRQFTCASSATQMLDNKTLSVVACSSCNGDYDLLGGKSK